MVGGGHNGLICAAYLARAGVETMVVESRDQVGGAASTVSDLGARFNICNCDHTMVRALPLAEELDLNRHGLRYLEPVASTLNVYYDESNPWAIFHDVDETVTSISTAMPTQGDAYRRYLQDALPVAELVVEMARTNPTTIGMLRTVVGRRARGATTLLRWSRQSLHQVLSQYFDDWRMLMPATAVGPTVWGAPPTAPGTGMAAVGYAVRHVLKTGRPEGGSGALTDAVAASFTLAGGETRTGARVASLLIKDSKVGGVKLSDGTVLRSRLVVAACDPRRVMLDWVDEPPPAARKMVESLRSEPDHHGYESKIDGVLTAPTVTRWAEYLNGVHPGVDLTQPTVVVNPSPNELAEAHALRSEGRVAARPTLLMNQPTTVDPTMAPAPGQHILSLEALFTPYALPGGWPESSEPQRWLDLWADFAQPGFAQSIDRWRVMTPDRYEKEFSMHRGHTPSYAGPPLAALLGRGTYKATTRYKAPIDGLYFTGAGTYPGAGVFGASGRNAAAAILRAR